MNGIANYPITLDDSRLASGNRPWKLSQTVPGKASIVASKYALGRQRAKSNLPTFARIPAAKTSAPMRSKPRRLAVSTAKNTMIASAIAHPLANVSPG